MKSPESNIEWKKWGDTDPLWGVATWEGKDKAGKDPWTDEEFYKLGEMDWRDFFAHWQKYGVDDQSCLEIGCGTGRITMQLAKHFKETRAVDVSEGMIAYAQTRIKDPSVKFLVSDGIRLPGEDGSVTAVFSSHVFQHFDSLGYASQNFAEISRVLKPGGSMMIHLPIFQWHPETPRIFIKLIQIRKHIKNSTMWIRRRLIQSGLSKPMMQSLKYPIDYFYKYLPLYGFTNIEISLFSVKSNGGVHPFVFAQKDELIK